GQMKMMDVPRPLDVREAIGTVPDSLRCFTQASCAFPMPREIADSGHGGQPVRAPKCVRAGVPGAFAAIYAAAGTARGRRIGRLTMTEPTGGPPSPQPPQSPPPQAPAPQPPGGSWGAPPPATAPGGFQTQ